MYDNGCPTVKMELTEHSSGSYGVATVPEQGEFLWNNSSFLC